jgi:D-cysteine desulfhydrase
MKDWQLPAKTSWSLSPTPIQKLSRISELLGAQIWIKRDDLTGFECSGNKIRKLEFLVHEALSSGANTLITCGGIQSNHCRATAALAAKLGLRCVLLLRGEEPKVYRSNFLLDKIFGAEILYLTEQQYYHEMADVKLVLDQQIRSQGGKTYFIPEGGSNGLGSLGYASVYYEIEEQRSQSGFDLKAPFDSIICANGSGGTQAGLIFGKISTLEKNDHTKVIGVNVCYDQTETFRRVKDALWQAIHISRAPLSFMSEDILVLDGFLGDGYAKSRAEERDWILKMARLEGVLLDPVYTGKAFFGLVQTLKLNPDYLGKNILFLHSGGGFGNFQLEEPWAETFRNS